MTANLGSTTSRNIPDVALTATNIFITADNGAFGGYFGTSCSAPLCRPDLTRWSTNRRPTRTSQRGRIHQPCDLCARQAGPNYNLPVSMTPQRAATPPLAAACPGLLRHFRLRSLHGLGDADWNQFDQRAGGSLSSQRLPSQPIGQTSVGVGAQRDIYRRRHWCNTSPHRNGNSLTVQILCDRDTYQSYAGKSGPNQCG